MAHCEPSSSNETTTESAEEKVVEKKHGFSEDEEMLTIRMYNLVGERWSLIAGRIPGRTAEEIEKYWNTRHCTSDKKGENKEEEEEEEEKYGCIDTLHATMPVSVIQN